MVLLCCKIVAFTKKNGVISKGIAVYQNVFDFVGLWYPV